MLIYDIARFSDYKTSKCIAQYWDHENVSRDTVLWHYNKSKTTDGWSDWFQLIFASEAVFLRISPTGEIAAFHKTYFLF